MKRIGIYGGTFDPIHFGHINLAIEILEKSNLDQILFCPAYISPHKIDSPPIASAKDRAMMTEIAIKEIDSFSLCREEIEKEEISYTIDTLKILEKKFKHKAQIFLIITQDSVERFTLWKGYKQILEITPLIIGGRSNFLKEQTSFEFNEIVNKDFIITKQLEISSTDIRNRLNKKLYCGHLVDTKVLDYIYKNRVY